MSRKTRTKSKTRNNAKSRAKKATVSTVKSTDTEETVIPTAECYVCTSKEPCKIKC